ncbi:MAG: hypothetical protein OXQ89_10290 [Rhodospirillaceae bacterium]|nr:hypothetical protein [Rhodospirillaceae bacterium]
MPDRLSFNIVFNEHLLATGRIPQQRELYMAAGDHGSNVHDGQRRGFRVALAMAPGAMFSIKEMILNDGRCIEA